jgi:hypothetical protein
VDADTTYLVDAESEDLLIGRRPVDAAVRRNDVAVE